MDGIVFEIFPPATRGVATRGPAVVNPTLRRMRRLALAALLGCSSAGLATGALAAVTCKPVLSIKNVRELRAPNAQVKPWTWSATIVADTQYCATAAGDFEIDFVRLKEASPDLQFTEKYRWGPRQFDVSVELTGDEAIDDYRIGFVAPCVCRELPWP